MKPAVYALRHDLRTAVNHLVGYGEMLQEDAESADDADRLKSLARIREATAEILASIDRSLPASLDNLAPDRVLELGVAVRGPVDTILEECGTLSVATAHDPVAAADVAKIESSARLLLRFADEGPDAIGRSTPAPAPRLSSVFPQSGADAAAGSRILVADDDAGNRDLLGRRLNRLGHDVAYADDGAQVLAIMETERFDLVLLDFTMPVLTGSDVLKRLRADPRFRDLPILMISADNDQESMVRCIARGADDFLPKPFDSVLLRARIGACLERKRWRDQEAEYLRQVGLLTQGAALLEAGSFSEGTLDEVVVRPDALGKLARVFSRMAHEVQAREQRLNRQVEELKIEIDETRKSNAVSAIVESDHFQELQRKVTELRGPTAPR